MKNSKIHLISLLLLSFVIISACNYNQNSTTNNTEECDFVPKDTINMWVAEFQKPPYDVYRNFNDIAFPKEFITDKTPFPENKHLIFVFGMNEETEQTSYLFALTGIGIIGETIDLDYASLMYYSEDSNKWVKTEKAIFESSTNNWKLYIEEFGPLPTLGFTVPNQDINVCAHKSYDRIRLGIDTSTDDINYQLKLYFHEEEIEENPDGNDFDACVPCPPICGG